MPTFFRAWVGLLLAVALAVAAPAVDATDTDEAPELAGLWRARRCSDAGLHGTLTVERRPDSWRAEIGAFAVEVPATDPEVVLRFPDGRGTLRGVFDAEMETLEGFWVQPPPVQIGAPVASPVRFTPIGPGRWRGQVVPRESGFTLYIRAVRRPDGSIGAFLRNPDRNLGIFYDLKSIETGGDTLRFVGRSFRGSDLHVLFEGVWRPDEDSFSAYLSGRGGTYDFHRVDDQPSSAFFARGKDPRPYVYMPPPEESDGWPTATLDDVGLSLAPLAEMIEKEIDPPAQDVHAHDVHGVLIARHGRLVLEEYFHGFHREVPHDTRSASKSMTSMITGAAILAGAPLGPGTPVYRTLAEGAAAGGGDPRWQRMTLEHLLTMSSGLYCDDSDPNAPGNEDVMQEQETEPDWYRYTLRVPMASEPGAEAVYCSANPNLIGAVLTAVTGEPLERLIDRLIARPLDIDRYYLFLQPTGEPYMGGGIHWLPRDFMKLGQVMLNGGTWRGRRIVSERWAARSTSTLQDLQGREYGYLWWIKEYPYRGRTVHAFLAGGNGGQVVIGIPELDMLIAFFGGNYNDRVLYRAQDVLVPDYILPAVDARPVASRLSPPLPSGGAPGPR